MEETFVAFYSFLCEKLKHLVCLLSYASSLMFLDSLCLIKIKITGRYAKTLAQI